MAYTLKRWSARALRTAFLLSALGFTAVFGRAQGPQAPPAPQAAQGGRANPALPAKSYQKSGRFDLPLTMPAEVRATLREVQLWVKTPTADWARQDVGQASVTKFTYSVPEDGEYWFSLVTVDKAGKASTEDVRRDPPTLRVVVDRQPPTLQFRPRKGGADDALLCCACQDPNLDPTTLHAVIHTASGEVALDAVAGEPGVFRLPASDSAGAVVKISIADLAGNVTSREVPVRELLASIGMAANADVATVSNRPRPERTDDIITVPAQPPVVLNNGNSFEPVAPRSPVSQDPTASAPTSQPTSAPFEPVRRASAGNRQLIGTTRATVEYRIDQVGPSGIGKVEVYLTPDQGQTWQRLREDTSRRSPVDLELPGEGLFGIRIVVTNGNGFGGTPPRRGDQPDCWIEVDTTAPFVQLRPIELVPQTGMLDIRWTASDKNLGDGPVTLFFRARPEGPWQLVGRNIKNDGSHRWAFPRDVGSTFYFKVEVADQAGNTVRVESPTPVVLDMTEPRASVVGVVGSPSRAMAPLGN